MWQADLEMLCVVPDSPSTIANFPSFINYNLTPRYNVLDFHTDYLQQVPSPSGMFEFNLSSPTMFSSSTSEKNSRTNSLEPSSPIFRPEGRSSTFSSQEFDSFNFKQSSSRHTLPDFSLELKEEGNQYVAGTHNTLDTLNQGQNNLNKNEETGMNRESTQEPEVAFSIDGKTEVMYKFKENPVISMAVEMVKKEIDVAARNLNISINPNEWSQSDAMCWMEWAMAQYNTSSYRPLKDWVGQGSLLVKLNEEEFKDKIISGGDKVYAQLDIWKTNALWGQVKTACPMRVSESSSSNSKDGASPTKAEKTDNRTSEKAKGKEGQVRSTHIHLWQFVKDLLNKSHQYSGIIQWIDSEKGIFKIIDSVRVAQLWGQCKHRPAMNYDKLSRSLRQYYKKGIMKKTQRTQRLVYQFCPPYHL